MKTKVSHTARLASVLVVLMLGFGACCCQGALLSGLLRPAKSCCEKAAHPVRHQEDCHCSGKVLAEGKVDTFSGLPSLPKPAADLHDVLQPVFLHGAQNLLHAVPAVAHAPPPRVLRSFLQVWLI